MKLPFQRLNNSHFNLTYNVRQQFKVAPEPTVVSLTYKDFTLIDGIKKKTSVYPGMLLAKHPLYNIGDLFSPIHGIITELTSNTLCITATDPQNNLPECIPINLLHSEYKGEALANLIKTLGVSTHSLTQNCKTLIINGLNPEPGISWAEPMLQEHTDILQTGLTLCKRITNAENILLALPEAIHSKKEYYDIPIAYVQAKYPTNLDPLLVKTLTNREFPEDISTVGIHTIWELGTVGNSGKPLTETILTIGTHEYSENYIVKEGTTINDILQFTNIHIQNNDMIILGGPFRGKSIDQLSTGITKETIGVFIVRSGSTPSMQRNYPCISCGACVQICPSRLNPDILSRYTEFHFYERCQKEYIESCIECGLCTYVCPARRPILQHIRLAKHTINKKNQQNLQQNI